MVVIVSPFEFRGNGARRAGEPYLAAYPLRHGNDCPARWAGGAARSGAARTRQWPSPRIREGHCSMAATTFRRCVDTSWSVRQSSADAIHCGECYRVVLPDRDGGDTIPTHENLWSGTSSGSFCAVDDIAIGPAAQSRLHLDGLRRGF